MTITVGAGTTFAALDAVLAEHGQECPLDPRDPTRDGRRRARVRALGHPPAAARAGPRPACSRSASSPADGRVVKGGGPTVKNVTGYDLPRLFVGSLGTLGVLVQVDAAVPAARRSRAVVPRPTERPERSLPARPRCCGTVDDVHVRLEGTAPTSTRKATPMPRTVRPAADCPRARTAAASRSRPARSRVALGSPTRRRAVVRRARRRHRARRRRHDRGARRGARGRGTRTAAGCCAKRAATARRLRPPAAEPARSCSASRTRSIPTASSHPGGSRCDRRRVVHAARARRGRARRVRRVRAVPAALPDLPRHRPRDRVAAWAASRRCARSNNAAPDRRRVPPRDGRVRAVPRLRGRVPVGRAVRPPDGGHTRARARRSAAARPPRRLAEWLAYRVVLPRHWLLLALTWLLLVGQRLHLVPRRFGLPRSRSPSLRPLDVAVGGAPDAWLFTGCVMDAWMRDTHRVDRARHARRPARGSRGPDAAATAAARCTCMPAATTKRARSPRRSSRRCRATRRSSSTARGAARR